MIIVPAQARDAETIAAIIREANKDVAELFGITIENTPKHPSFCRENWVLAGIQRGEEYFLCKEENLAKGCVAFEQAGPDTAYLNRLSVLPRYRHTGIGTSLVRHVVTHSKAKQIQTVSIGIIAEHDVLKSWYADLGFIEGGTRTFDHLPFTVQYMHYTT